MCRFCVTHAHLVSSRGPDSSCMCGAPSPLVTATGALYPDLVIGLGVVDSRAMVTHFGSDNRDPIAAYTDTTWKNFNSGLKLTLDQAINVAFNLGDMDVGAVADMRYVYSLRQDALEGALSSLNGLKIVSPSLAVSGDSAPFVVIADGSVSRVDFYVIKDGTESLVRCSRLGCEGIGGGAVVLTACCSLLCLQYRAAWIQYHPKVPAAERPGCVFRCVQLHRRVQRWCEVRDVQGGGHPAQRLLLRRSRGPSCELRDRCADVQHAAVQQRCWQRGSNNSPRR